MAVHVEWPRSGKDGSQLGVAETDHHHLRRVLERSERLQRIGFVAGEARSEQAPQ